MKKRRKTAISVKKKQLPAEEPQPPLQLSLILQFAILLTAYFILNLLVFSPMLDNWFFKDDFEWLFVGKHIANAPSYLFTPDPDNTEYLLRQTQRLTFVLNYVLNGLKPFGYYFFNIILHSLTSVLVYIFLYLYIDYGSVKKLRTETFNIAALAGSAIFNFTYAHADAILWLAARSSILVTQAILIVLILIIKWDKQLRDPLKFTVIVVAYIIALLSKVVAITFPFCLALMWFCQTKEDENNRFGKEKIALFGVLLILAVTFGSISGFVTGGKTIDDVLHGEEGSWGLSRAFIFNWTGAFLACFIPAEVWFETFKAFIPYPIVTLLLLAMLGVGMYFWKVRWRLIFGIGWVFLAALPTSTFSYYMYWKGQLTVKRYYYLPMLGAVIIIVFLLKLILERYKLNQWQFVATLGLCFLFVVMNIQMTRSKTGKYYDASFIRQTIIHNALSSVRSLPQDSIVFAYRWPIPDYRIRRISYVFFEDYGVTLKGNDQLEGLKASGVPIDGRQRFLAYLDPRTMQVGMQPLNVEE